MEINVFGNKTLLSRDVKKYAIEKISKVSRFSQDIIGVDITLEENHHRKNKTKAVAKALVKIPGKDIAAKAEAKTIFAAIDVLESKLDAQLSKNKEKKSFKGRLSKSRSAVKRLLKRGR